LHSVGLTRMKRSSTGGGGDGGKKQKGAQDFEGDFPRGKPAASDMKDMKKPQTKVRHGGSASAPARDSRRCSHQQRGGIFSRGRDSCPEQSFSDGLSPHQSNITALPP